MKQKISRRTLAQSTLWSFPVIITSSTIPAYAASHLDYYWGESQNQTLIKSGTSTTVDIYTTDPVSPEVAGFSIGYESGQATDTTATLQKLEYYFMVPNALVSSGNPQMYGSTATYWTAPTKVTASTLQVSTGSGTYKTVSTSGYTLYKMTFKGITTNPVVVEAKTTTWPESTIDISVFGASSATQFTVYTGYSVSFTTANGYTKTNSTTIQEFVIRVS